MELNHGTGPVFTDDTGTRATASRRVMRGLCGLIALGVVAVVLSAALHITLPGLDHPLTLPGTKHPSSPAPRVSKHVGQSLPSTDPVSGPATGAAAPSPVAAVVSTPGPAAPSPVTAPLATAGPARRTPAARSSATLHPRPASASAHPSATSPTHPAPASPTHPAAASPTHPVAASPSTRPRVVASRPALPSPTRKFDPVVPASPSGTPVAGPTR